MSSNPSNITPLYLPELLETKKIGKGKDEVPCLMCEESFPLSGFHNTPCWKKDVDVIRTHLVRDHQFVIADIDQVSDIKGYFDYWKRKLAVGNITDFCSVITTNTGDGDMEPSANYLMLSADVLPEDRQLREKLSLRRLTSVLKDYHQERDDDSFSHMCLFCRKVFEGNRRILLEHLKEIHNLNLGHPDNLVYVKELLDILDVKLHKFICLFCENVFKDWDVLKEHMRKKGHKQLNPDNPEYDRFYLVNYLEPGKSWKSSRRADERTEFEDYEQDWSGWEEALESTLDNNNTADWTGNSFCCLFCPHLSHGIDDLALHMKEEHGFSLSESLKGFPFYDKVKLINFIRRRIHSNGCHACEMTFNGREELQTHFKQTNHTSILPTNKSDWDCPEYFFPTFENDHLLHSLEDEENEEDNPAPSDHATVVPEEVKTIAWDDIPSEIRDLIMREKEKKLQQSTIQPCE